MRLIAFLVSLIILGACSKRNMTSPKEEINTPISELNLAKDQSIILSITTSPCFGKCPVYELSVYANREVVFNGIKFTDVEGERRGTLSSQQYEMLLNEAEKAQLFEAKPVYDNPAITDLPATNIVYILNGKKASIKARYDVPQEIQDFVQFSYELTSKVKWVETAVD